MSAAPAQDGAWNAAIAALREHGLADRYVPETASEVAARVRSPVFRDGAFMPGAATVQPAALARGLRRVLLERGVTIFEGTEAVEIDGQRRGPIGRSGRVRGERRPDAATAWASDPCGSDAVSGRGWRGAGGRRRSSV